MLIGITNSINSTNRLLSGGGGGGVASNFIPLIFDIGQSNSIGRAESDRLALTSYSKTPDGVKIYYKTAYGATDNGTWQAIDTATNCKEPDAAGGQRTFGGYLSLATKLRDLLAREVYVVAAGDGGTALAQGVTANDWNPNTVGSCYERATSQYFSVAITKLQALYPGRQVVVFISWHQGESDAPDATALSAYSANFTAFITALRASHALLANARLYITKLWYSKSAAEGTINTVFTNYQAANSSTTALINISGYPQKDELTVGQIGGFTATTADDNHQSYLAQIAKGELIYTNIVSTNSYIQKVPFSYTSPGITGTSKVGNTLTASTGTWLGGSITYAYQWKRDAVVISGATANTYVLVTADYNTLITVSLIATNSAGSTTATSLATSAILPANPVNTVAPAITGTITEGNTLTCSTGTWTSQNTIIYAYQWKRGATNVGTNANTYVLVSGDVGSTMTCVVTATNSGGATTQVSNTTTTVQANASIPVNTVLPAVTGTTTANSILTTTSGTWTNTPTSYNYQWKRDATNIGTNTSTYTLVEDDVTTAITCVVTAVNAGGNSAPATSNSTSIPARTLPTFSSVGTRQVGVAGVTIPINAGATTNDIMFILIETANNTVTVPSGWTHLTASPQGVGTSDAIGAIGLTILWKRHTGTESSVVIADPGEHINAQMFVFSGVNTTVAPGLTAVGNSNTTAITAFSVSGPTSTIHNELLVIAVASGIDSSTSRWNTANNMAATGATGMTNDQDQSNTAGNGGGIAVWHATLVNPITVTTVSATANTATEMAWIIFTLKPV